MAGFFMGKNNASVFFKPGIIDFYRIFFVKRVEKGMCTVINIGNERGGPAGIRNP